MTLTNKYLYIFSLSLILAGCAAKKRVINLDGFRYELALMPMANETSNLDGPILLRKALYNKLMAHGYSMMTLEETDSLLKDMGITDGGQLNAIPVAKIAEKLQARKLVFTNLKTFKPLRVALVEVIKVNVRLFNSRALTMDWEIDQGVFSQEKKYGAESTEKYLKHLFGFALMEKLLHSPLSLEIDKITDIIALKIVRTY